jgi:carbonic anhydrase
MIFSRSSVTAALVALALPLLASAILASAQEGGIFASSQEGVFNYDPTSPLGPSHWGDLHIDGNQCNGRKNSPINVEDPGCTIFADYKLTVSLTESNP